MDSKKLKTSVYPSVDDRFKSIDISTGRGDRLLISFIVHGVRGSKTLEHVTVYQAPIRARVIWGLHPERGTDSIDTEGVFSLYDLLQLQCEYCSWTDNIEIVRVVLDNEVQGTIFEWSGKCRFYLSNDCFSLMSDGCE